MDLPLCARVSLTWDIHCDDGRCVGAGTGAGAGFGAGFLKLDTVLLMGAFIVAFFFFFKCLAVALTPS